MDKLFLRKIGFYILLLAAAVVLMRVTQGYAAIPILLFGLFSSMKGRTTFAVCCYVFFPFIVCMNRYLMTVTMPLMICARFGVLLLGVSMAIFAVKGRKFHIVPLGMLTPYILLESVSSAFGYCPNVSYLKLIFFAFFVMGMWLGTRNLSERPILLWNMRAFFLAICIFTIVGSLLTLPFPAVAYPVNSQWLVKDGMDLATANEVMRTQSDGISLFAGITTHSQMLSPLLTMIVGFLMCDMLFVHQKKSWFHMLMIFLALVFAFLTRSRTALFSLAVTIFMVCFIAAPRMRLAPHVKQIVQRIITTMLVVILVGGAAMEIRSRAITNWLFKGEDRRSSVVSAVTSTRMGAIERMKEEFAYNPMFGCGFQVNADSARFRKQGFVLSAPIEKGLLPVMVIGEGGIIGCLLFLAFLFSFYVQCLHKGYFATMTGFTSLVATNIGEGTFFSPGGVGGILWMFAIVGGFVVDMLVSNRKRMLAQQYMEQQYAAQQAARLQAENGGRLPW